MRLGKGSAIAYELLREHVPALGEDRILAPDLRIAKDLLWNSSLLDRVSKVVKIV